MSDLFIKIFNLSVTAGWLTLAVLLCRPMMKKVPKWISCLLWGIVGLRLCLPFSFESIFSLIPSAEPLPEDIMMTQTPVINSGVSVLNDAVNPIISTSLAPTVGASINPMQIVIAIASWGWVIGIALMLGYGIVSYISLRVKVRVSVKGKDKVYFCDDVDSPFILGVIKPRIYVPSGMRDEALEHVLAHEKAHLRRGDHLWKPVGFALLSLYWFNPLLWVAYALLCRDIESACDEKAIKEMSDEAKKGYSEALLACSLHRKRIMACPLAFGEVGVKQRIKSVLNYKKPAFWIIIVALISTLILSVCFLTNPRREVRDLLKPDTAWECQEYDVFMSFYVDKDGEIHGYLEQLYSNEDRIIDIFWRDTGKNAIVDIYISEINRVELKDDYLLLSGVFRARGEKLVFEIKKDNLGLKYNKLELKQRTTEGLVGSNQELAIPEPPTFSGNLYVRVNDYGCDAPAVDVNFIQAERSGDDICFVLEWNNNGESVHPNGPDFSMFRYEGDELVELSINIPDVPDGVYYIEDAVSTGTAPGGKSIKTYNLTERFDIYTPGKYRFECYCAWVEFEVVSEGKSETTNEQPAVFDPSYSAAYDPSRKYDVYVWQMTQNFSFGLLDSKPRGWLDDELWDLKGVNASQMRQILLDKNLGPDDVNIVRWQNPISSYIGDFWVIWPYMNDNTPQENLYYAMIYDMLFGTSPRRYYPTATESERFDIDGDGTKEDNRIFFGLVDGKFMFRYIISEDNKTASYDDTFYTEPMSLKFFTSEEKLRLRGVTEDGSVHIYAISLDDGHVKLAEIEHAPIADASKKTLDLLKADLSLVDRIVITNGQTGEVEYLNTYTDKTGFNGVINAIKSIKATDPVSSRGYYGFTYYVELYYDYQTVFSFSLCPEADGASITCGYYETVGGFDYPARYKLTNPTYEKFDELLGKYFK